MSIVTLVLSTGYLAACATTQVLPPEPNLKPGSRLGILVQLAKQPVVSQHYRSLFGIKRKQYRTSINWDLQSKASAAIKSTFERAGYQVVMLDPADFDPSSVSYLIKPGEAVWEVNAELRPQFEQLRNKLRLDGLVVFREAMARWLECSGGAISVCQKDNFESGLFTEIRLGISTHQSVPGYAFKAFSFEPLGELGSVSHIALHYDGQIDWVRPEGYRVPNDPQYMKAEHFEPVINTIVEHLVFLSRELAHEYRLAPGERAKRDSLLD